MWMRSYPRHAILYWQFIQKINFGYTYLLDLSFFQNLLFVKIYCPDTAFLGPCSCHLRVRYLCLTNCRRLSWALRDQNALMLLFVGN
jgi:hypothetical protein